MFTAALCTSPPFALSAERPATSLLELMLARLDHSFDRPALCDALDGGRTWTWGELIAAAVETADHFVAARLCSGDRLAHLGTHSPDWIVVDLACQLAGIVHVPLHADATAAEHADQLRWLKPRGIVWSGSRITGVPDAPAAAVMIDLRFRSRGQAGFGGQGPETKGLLRATGWQQRWADRGGLRRDVARWAAGCDPEAMSVILLSSGTTGRPKGVMHNQRAVVANAVAAADVFLDDPRDVRLSWLPLSHSLARTGDLVTALVRGSCLNVVTDRRRVLDACLVLPPTVVLGVPAFFERLEQAAEAGTIADLPAALGGRVRVCVSGGAPLRARTATAFLRRGLPLVQGYGLAEAGPVVTLSNPRNARPGAVGLPLAGVELRLDTRPETRGQLLVRTPSRAVGVITADIEEHLPAAAAASRVAQQRPDGLDGLDDSDNGDDWIETGDLAAIDADGQVRITGRLVDTIVLSGGIKLPPAEVEAALAEDPAVAQVCVVGAGLAAPVALVVPNPAVLRAAVKQMGVKVWSRRAALRHPQVVRWLARRIAQRQRHLPRGWRVRRAVLVGRPFDAAHDEATASLKLKRAAIALHFPAELSAAAKPQPPAWVAVVSPGPAVSEGPPVSHEAGTTLNEIPSNKIPSNEIPSLPRSSWAATTLWGRPQSEARVADGFAVAAAAATEPLREHVAAVVEQATTAILSLRSEGRLYEAAPGPPLPPAPIVDAPPPTAGRFSRAAEESLGVAGLWGLFVPEQFGGTGCSMQELARVITKVAANVPTAAGMLAVHSAIGAVASLVTFGSQRQQERHLPGLAQGRPLSIFAATEPDVGCDLQAIRTRLDRCDGRLLLSGTKMFITGATHGRLVKLLALLDGRPTVILLRLPEADTPSFRLLHYGLHPLKHAQNAALEFDRFEVDATDILTPPQSSRAPADGMQIVWHGLNLGRVTLAAQAAGTLRLLLSQARTHALARHTWAAPIASRELVQGRLARIAAGIMACDSLTAWAAAAIDAGQAGELEAMIAKVVASEAVREGAINSLGVHGGRSFLVGHPLGDSFHDHFAVTVYEGESDLLGLALFKGLCKQHPLAGLARETSANRRATAWLAWRMAGWARRQPADDRAILDRRLRDHAAVARRLLNAAAIRIDRGLRRHGKGLGDRQLLVGSWSTEVRELVSVLAVAHHADTTGNDGDLLAADCWCRLAVARARGRRLTAADHAALALLGRMVTERDTGF